jgi:hypothetical protein
MASRKEEKERRRQERLAQERALEAQERRRRLYAIVVGGGLVIAAIAAIVVVAASGGGGGSSDSSGLPAATDPPPEKTRNLVAAAAAAKCTLKNPPIEGREHTTDPVKYKTNPPTSGNHNPQPAADGEYGKDPGTMHLVHSLEHGRVIIQWAPTTPRRRIAQLRGLFEEDPYHLILTPNGTKMPDAVAVTAWGHSASCKKFTSEAFDVFRDFKTRYVDKGPEFVP